MCVVCFACLYCAVWGKEPCMGEGMGEHDTCMGEGDGERLT